LKISDDESMKKIQNIWRHLTGGADKTKKREDEDWLTGGAAEIS